MVVALMAAVVLVAKVEEAASTTVFWICPSVICATGTAVVAAWLTEVTGAAEEATDATEETLAGV